MTDTTQTAASTITIDGKLIATDQLTEDAKKQIISIRLVDQEIVKIEQNLAIFRTARAAYARSLQEEIAKMPT